MSLPEASRVILIVDDSEANRYALGRILSKAGYGVREAVNGREALAIAREHPDLVILDVNLPDVNGFEVCRQLKRDPVTADLPVLQMSASLVRGADRAEGLDAGADGYLVQPIEPPELLATVRALLRTRDVEEELRRLNATLESRVAERTAAAEEARAEAQALLALSRALDKANTVDNVAEFALDTLSKAIGVGFLVILQPSGAQVLPSRYYGEVGAALRQELEAGFHADEPAVATGLHGESHYSEGSGIDRLAEHGVTGTAVVPLPAGAGEARTLLLVGRFGESHPWTATERRLLEAAVRSIALAFERVRFTNRLAEQKAELEARSSEQETFLYTVSHDLRAPLLSIQGMASLLREAVGEGDSSETEFLLERIDKNIATMGNLLGDLLQLSRVGRMVEDATVVDVGEVAETVLTDLGARIEQCGTRVETPLEWPTVLYPPSEVYQLLANTLGNAVKFSCGASQPAQVSLTWAREGQWVTLRVSDNGPGIPEAQRARVFDLFRKLDAKSEGTGVGLAIVKRIVERHGGRVWVEDSPLGGVAFAFTLPAFSD